MKTYEFKKYGNTYQMRLAIETYHMSGNLAIQMYTFDKEDGWELWNTMTVNLYEVPDKNCAFIDTNNNGEMILDWIKNNKLAVPTGNIGFSGYCQYPEYRFKTKALQEMDPEGYAKHLETRKAYLEDNTELKITNITPDGTADFSNILAKDSGIYTGNMNGIDVVVYRHVGDGFQIKKPTHDGWNEITIYNEDGNLTETTYERTLPDSVEDTN